MGTVLVASLAARKFAGPAATNTDTFFPMISATIGATLPGSPSV